MPALSGILSPCALIPDLFELRFLDLDAVGMGRAYVARVWATRPDSGKPVSGVSLTASFGDKDEEDTPKGLKSQARTNSRGEALLTFRLPEMPGASEKDLPNLLHGKMPGFIRSVVAAGGCRCGSVHSCIPNFGPLLRCLRASRSHSGRSCETRSCW